MSHEAPFGGPIVTGEAVAVEVRAAGAGSRGVAVFIDLTIVFALLMLLSLIATNLIGSIESAAAQAVVLTASIVIFLGYPVGMETLWHGRTLGKAAMGLRAVRDDGGPLRFRHAFVRGLVGVVLDRPGLSLGFLALVPMMMSERSKRLGDYAAGTIVVQERVPARVGEPPPMPFGLESWAAGLDLSRVDDALALEVRHFLARSDQLSPWTRDAMGYRLYGELTTRTAPPPPGVPPVAYFAAVLAERRRRELARLAPPPTATPPPGLPHSPVFPPTAATPPNRPADGPFAPPS